MSRFYDSSLTNETALSVLFIIRKEYINRINYNNENYLITSLKEIDNEIILLGGSLSVDEKRETDYLDNGCSVPELIIALWEQVVENRPSIANSLQIKRQNVKNNNPK
jgi:hypothetical protein